MQGAGVSYETMDVVELRHEYQAALERACELCRRMADAFEREDYVTAGGMHMAFKAQDAQVRRLKRLLTVEAV